MLNKWNDIPKLYEFQRATSGDSPFWTKPHPKMKNGNTFDKEGRYFAKKKAKARKARRNKNK